MESLWGTSGRQISTLRTTTTRHNGWIYPSWRSSRARRMRFSSSTSALQQLKDKPYYITTPIFYVNDSPHIGHLYSMTLADVLKRWQVLKGREAYLSTGTDEHGMKVQRAAELQDMPPKQLCDTNAENFKDLAKKANISNDYFIRTTDPEHRDAVEYFWERLRESGYMYESKHEGWYCVSDETFYPDSMVAKSVSPETGKAIMTSVETGNTVEWTEEKNYHFRLMAFRDKLLKFYEDNPNWVAPQTRLKPVISWVQNNLEDLSISRPASRLSWGIPVPGDPSQIIYVWVDALVNYLTTAGYPLWPPGSEHVQGWPADAHVIGKDINRFHCIYWPAFLMAVNIPLPRHVLCHGHWLMGKQKMSKSRGNVVNPFFALDRWGVDTVRFFLMSRSAISNNADYNNESIFETYKKGFQGGLGNLLVRVARSKSWNLRDAVESMAPKRSDSLLRSVEAHKDYVEWIVNRVVELMETLNPSRALKEIMKLVYCTNKFFSDTAPWIRIKEGHVNATNQIIYHVAETLRIVGILLQPFVPEKSAGLLDRLGVSIDRRTLSDAKLYADDSYGIPAVPLGTGSYDSLFPPLAMGD
ncbi:methionyl-tRNA synthetase [Biscogniauxia marginata]|nr:methionyl-tRNA synthetase [Biscogniauxia marginata]